MDFPNQRPDDAIVEIPFSFTSEEKIETLPHTPVTDSVGCQHYFIRRSATEVECRNPSCKLGLFVSPADQIIDGRLTGG